jgi:hypothetical protein
MSRPIDRGIVVIDTEADGTKTVRICAQMRHGEPVSVYAKHTGISAVNVSPGVAMVTSGSRSHSRGIVEASGENGQVEVRPVTAIA